jgi:uncharacterized membrane protein YhaH (DUF805 family)
MNTDPYAPPAADLDSQSYPVATSLWRARGRLGMLAFWAQTGLLTLLGALIVGSAVVIGYGTSESLDILQNGTVPDTPPAESVGLITFGLLVPPILLVVAYMGICMIIKRLHDLGLSGWWSLLLLLPLIGLLFLMYVFFWPGKAGNRFGAPRRTRGWEKLLGGLFLLLTFSSMVAGIYLGAGERLHTPDADLGTQATVIAATLTMQVT